MTTEQEAQALLIEKKVARAIEDRRSCLQIAVALGLIEPALDLEAVQTTSAESVE